MIISGLTFSIFGLFGLIISGEYTSLLLFIISTFFAGIGQGLTFLGSMGLIANNAPASKKAETISAFYIIIYLGVGIPVILIGFISEYIGIISSMLVYSVFISVLSVFVIAVLLINLSGRKKIDRARNPKVD